MYIAQILKKNEPRPQNIILNDLQYLDAFIQENEISQIVISTSLLVIHGDIVDESDWRLRYVSDPNGTASGQPDNVNEECKDSD